MYPEKQYAVRALKAGAAGYLSKESAPEELLKAVRTILLGRKHISPDTADNLLNELENWNDKAPHESLSPREFVVFQLVSTGKSVSAIAKQLSVAVSTVSTYKTKILLKMKMKSSADLTRYALENKLM
jgi:DNA-binding NarL/FixJ family response regulator